MIKTFILMGKLFLLIVITGALRMRFSGEISFYNFVECV